jgi:SPP1 gp7 family putative phage head morphogenesis protein
LRGQQGGAGGESPWFRGWSPVFGGQGAHTGYEAARRAALRARRAENQFAVQLRHLARHIGQIISGMADPADPSQWVLVVGTLEDYGRLITPWATSVSRRMLAEVERRDAASWHQLGQTINRALRAEIATAPIGPTLQQLLADQVHLITSLPREAAERVHALSLEAVTGGRRWEEIAADLRASGQVSTARANLIARTETGRAATALMEVRGEHVGSPGYIWRTAKDADVRPRHRELEGTFQRWAEPPIASEPGQRVMRYHPGSGPNCRCFPEIVLPGEPEGYRPVPRNPAYLAALRQAGYSTGAAFE